MGWEGVGKGLPSFKAEEGEAFASVDASDCAGEKRRESEDRLRRWLVFWGFEGIGYEGWTDLIVGCVCEPKECKEAKKRTEDDGSHGGVSAVGSAKAFFDEAVAIELGDGEEGAAGDVETGVPGSRSLVAVSCCSGEQK